ncbi:class I SAM-dependent methyltransferase [Legionella worsleiensis]|uniref:Ribosomal RNA small subunit methyltransferase J n=1 Tax=Legionella worsleiensis TaxID=45076 RepID=A0A0W1AJ30_9GAMM|nr:class I SAM-dependent methyltransferase [Legionella worsleiensis]KTD81187.1 SAM-dependent methyltransferase [Legionella worsleiensis]STY33163.1 N6-adenine-specific methylase [Legionella worsleiensis]
MTIITSLGYEHEDLKDSAVILAQQLHLNLDKDATSCLYLTAHKLTLKLPNFSLLYPDFTFATWSKRRAEGKKQGLIRACKPAAGLKIIDATAGWGRDAAILASFGAQVTMLERNPIMAALLSDALLRQSAADKNNLKLNIETLDTRTYLTQLDPAEYPDVIYIDPMHPQRNKSALVKKDMQALQQMIGTDEDACDLLHVALSHVTQRVVVKWPQKVTPLRVPDASIEGKTVRFDLYFKK